MHKKFYLLVIILLVLTGIFESVNIFLSNKLSSNSIQAALIQKDIDKIDAQNIALKTEVLSYSSYENVASRAAGLGYTYSRKYINVHAPLEVAKSN